MIEKPAVESFSRIGQATRRAQVRLAGPRVSARMVVGDEECRAAVHRRVDDDAAQREIEPACTALVARKVKTTRLIVEMGDPQALAGRILFLKAAGKECPSGQEATEAYWGTDTLMTHIAYIAAARVLNDANRL